MTFLERVRGRREDETRWHFDLAEEFNGGFGGTNGGLLAALCVHAARGLAPDRLVCGVDARFLRSFRPGPATVVAEALGGGRTLTTVRVSLCDAEGRLSTAGTVSLVAPEALAAIDVPAASSAGADLADPSEGKPWRQPRGHRPIPLIETFAPVSLGRSAGAIATASTMVWDDPTASAEAACVAADISVGPPVAAMLKGRPLAIPNPDLSLRFTGRRAEGRQLVSFCRLVGIAGGLATTAMEVFCRETLIATGISTTTCLDIPAATSGSAA